MNIFFERDYRLILKKAVASRKELDPTFTFQRLAGYMQVQQSYLSRAIHGEADLNADQLHLACDFLEFNDDQRAYLCLLLEHARSSLPQRRQKLEVQIEAIQKRFLETKEHLSASLTPEKPELDEYYFDPLHSVVHVSLLNERYRKNLPALAKDLGITRTSLIEILRTLERLGLISSNGNEFQVLVEHVTLRRESKFFRIWREQIRLMSLARMKTLADESYTYSVAFSADNQTRVELQRLFLDFLKQAEQLVKNAPATETYQLNFDLFPWTTSRSQKGA